MPVLSLNPTLIRMFSKNYLSEYHGWMDPPELVRIDFINYGSTWQIYTSLFAKFNLSALPAGAVVTSAYLSLAMSYTPEQYNISQWRAEISRLGTDYWMTAGVTGGSITPYVTAKEGSTLTNSYSNTTPLSTIPLPNPLTLDVTATVKSMITNGDHGVLMEVYPLSYGADAYFRVQGITATVNITYTVADPPSASDFVSAYEANGYMPLSTFFRWNFFNGGSGGVQSHYQIVASNDNWSTWYYNTGKVAGTNNWANIAAAGPLPDGTWQLALMVWDSVSGLPSIWTYSPVMKIDRTPPTVTGISKPINVPTTGYWSYQYFKVYCSDTESGVHFSNSYVEMYHEGNPSNLITCYGIREGTDGRGYYVEFEWKPEDFGISDAGAYYGHVHISDKVSNGPTVDPIMKIAYYDDRVAPIMGSPSPTYYTNLTTGTAIINGVYDNQSGIDYVQVYQVRPDSTYYDIGNATDAGNGQYSINITGMTSDGAWGIDFRAYDMAGNVAGPVRMTIMRDTTPPVTPTLSVLGLTKDSASIGWTPFSDAGGPAQSGYNRTTNALDRWNGSIWVGVYDRVLSYDVSAIQSLLYPLNPLTKYRYSIRYVDNLENISPFTWIEFTTPANKTKVGEFKLQKSGSVLTIPIYDPANGITKTSLRVSAKNGSVGCFELVPTSDPNASPIRVSTPTGIMSVSRE